MNGNAPPRLLQHIQHLRLEHVIDRLDRDGGAGLGHGEDVDALCDRAEGGSGVRKGGREGGREGAERVRRRRAGNTSHRARGGG